MQNIDKQATSGFSAVILAGGKSSRMNYTNKALIEIKGKPLLAYQIDKLKQHTQKIFISSNHPETYSDFKLPVISDDPFPSEGPLCAIAAALEKVKSQKILFIPCDSPDWPSELPQLLLDALNNTSADSACIKCGERLEPLFLLLKKSTKDSVHQAVIEGERKVHNWLKKNNSAFYNDKRSNLYLNLNTPEELNQFLKKY